ncbi:D-serine dehydratase [Fusarium oxysporum f. sp. albedinis]|nr:D-serine dehydratase [Fusarium oxysporum f. sp. albedinis]
MANRFSADRVILRMGSVDQEGRMIKCEGVLISVGPKRNITTTSQIPGSLVHRLNPSLQQTVINSLSSSFPLGSLDVELGFCIPARFDSVRCEAVRCLDSCVHRNLFKDHRQYD